MKNPTDDDAYHALFRSYKLASKEIKELQAQLALERERNLNNVANADLQIAELKAENARLRKSVVWDVVNALACADEYKCELAAAQAEITRLRAGGCARDQHTTQYCGELQAAEGER